MNLCEHFEKIVHYQIEIVLRAKNKPDRRMQKCATYANSNQILNANVDFNKTTTIIAAALAAEKNDDDIDNGNKKK